MPLDDEDVRLVIESLPLIREHLEPSSLVFYDNLFSIAPELRELFRDDLGGQGMRFMTTLTTIAELLDAPESFAAEVDRLASGHAGLGVRPEHFKPMGIALMVTLCETMRGGFDQRLQSAWRSAYDHIAAEMIRRGGTG